MFSLDYLYLNFVDLNNSSVKINEGNSFFFTEESVKSAISVYFLYNFISFELYYSLLYNIDFEDQPLSYLLVDSYLNNEQCAFINSAFLDIFEYFICNDIVIEINNVQNKYNSIFNDNTIHCLLFNYDKNVCLSGIGRMSDNNVCFTGTCGGNSVSTSSCANLSTGKLDLLSENSINNNNQHLKFRGTEKVNVCSSGTCDVEQANVCTSGNCGVEQANACSSGACNYSSLYSFEYFSLFVFVESFSNDDAFSLALVELSKDVIIDIVFSDNDKLSYLSSLSVFLCGYSGLFKGGDVYPISKEDRINCLDVITQYRNALLDDYIDYVFYLYETVIILCVSSSDLFSESLFFIMYDTIMNALLQYILLAGELIFYYKICSQDSSALSLLCVTLFDSFDTNFINYFINSIV